MVIVRTSSKPAEPTPTSGEGGRHLGNKRGNLRLKPGNTGFKSVFRASRYSWQGLRAAWQHESAFRQECTIGLLLIPAGMLLAETAVELAVLLAVCILVLITELLNSAIEAVVDRIGEEHHDLAGRAKDMGSAAVMLSLILLLTTWGFIAIQRFVS